MILQETNNIPVAAPEIDDMPSALNQFREWRGNSAITMADFVSFLKNVSPERADFFAQLTVQSQVISARYVIQKLS